VVKFKLVDTTQEVDLENNPSDLIGEVMPVMEWTLSSGENVDLPARYRLSNSGTKLYLHDM
jgi:hypothetical protein